MKMCLSCMNMIGDEKKVCPICGFDESKYHPDSACLKIGTVLGGKYIVGKETKETDDTVFYSGWDYEQEKRIIIEEFFPKNYSYRDPGENDIGVYAGDAVDLFKRRLEEFLRSDAIILRDNNTGYRIREYKTENPIKPTIGLKKRGAGIKVILPIIGTVIIIGVIGWFMIFERSDNKVDVVNGSKITSPAVSATSVSASAVSSSSVSTTSVPSSAVSSSAVLSQDASRSVASGGSVR